MSSGLEMTPGLGSPTTTTTKGYRRNAEEAIPGHPAPRNGITASAPRPLHPGHCTRCCLQGGPGVSSPARPPARPGSIPHWPGRARPTARPLAEPVTLRSPAPLPRPGAAPCSRGGTRSALLPPPGPARAPRRAPPDHGLGVRPLPPPRVPPGPRPATARPLPPGLPLHTPVLRAQQVVGEEARRVGDLAEEHQLRHLPPTPHHEPAPGPASPGPRQINGLAEEDRAPRKPS